jgi:GAF domain-containing protein
MIQDLILDHRFGFQEINTAASQAEMLKMENAKSKVLLETGCLINSSIELETVFDTIIRVACEVIEAEQASILIFNQRTNTLNFAAATGLQQHALKPISVPMDGSIAGWIMRHKKPEIVGNAHNDSRHYSQVDTQVQFSTNSMMGVPLQSRDKTIGVLEVINKTGGREFTRLDVEILEILADQTAIAVTNAQIRRQLQAKTKALKNAKKQLDTCKEWVAIGQAAADAAHQLNNPLTAIIGYAAILQANATDKESRHDLNRIIAQGQRAAEIVRELSDKRPD